MLLSALFSLSADLCLIDVRLEDEGVTLVRRRESGQRCVPCMRAAIEPCAWPLHTLAGRPALRDVTGARVPGSAALSVRYPWLSAHRLCGTLLDTHKSLRPTHPAPS